MGAISFKVLERAAKGKARAGVLTTPHGVIETPAFIAVGTAATVKGLSVDVLRTIGVQTLIANTYHLHLEPGADVVRSAGGLHNFMGWQGPILTDSGGFQVFSLGAAYGRTVSKVKREDLVEDARSPTVYDPDVASQHGRLAIVDEEGVTFTSHRDGSLHRFTPERSVEIQHKLGADIFYAFDECTAAEADYAYQRESLDRTHRWAQRSRDAHRANLDARDTQGLFGIVQGGRHEDLRRSSARTIADMGFDGVGIGGSYDKADLDTAVGWVTDELPEGLPRHLLGIGEPEDLLQGIAQGVDLFDCVQPTRLGRNGVVYGPKGTKLSLQNSRYVHDFAPIDTTCACHVCATYTRAYLAHLFRAGEMLGPMLASMHNLFYLTDLVRKARASILA